ncbi:glycerol-3-phosphate 1-O-acyltransferase PlsY [Candidatus Aerophobetes bacterium]|nr:glycerol-3-phosphate 1-O-acyltransferase PlsY [Candidatus Aerophobetes bacterium]
MIFILSVVAIGYLLGSLSGGYLVGRLAGGFDIRKFGSGNIGTTNVLRVLGKRYALFVLLLDFGKGAASIYMANLFAIGAMNPFLLRALAGLACITGHNWPVFLKFRGGKGVATAAGVFLILSPLPFAIAVLTMIAVVGATRYVSLGSIISAAALPFYIFVLMGAKSFMYIYLALAIAALIIWRHRSNLKRLVSGRENKLHLSKPSNLL